METVELSFVVTFLKARKMKKNFQKWYCIWEYIYEQCEQCVNNEICEQCKFDIGRNGEL